MGKKVFEVVSEVTWDGFSSSTLNEGGSSSSSSESEDNFEMDIRYVHFKKRSYYMHGVEKILF